MDGELETAVEMLAAVSAGEVTPGELAERALRRAEAWQPSTNAFSQIWADVLEGPIPEGVVPLAVKDLYDVQGRETTGCCRAYWGTVAERDAPVVQRVRDRFLPIGKTNQHELAAGGTNLVSACGRTGNPWDPDRITGGSSGGSAAAVAAGIVPVALGSDTGGSIRIPAALCGTFGLKPTTGRLPLDGLMPLAPSLDCPGPIAGTVADLRLLLRQMEGRETDSGPPDDGERGPKFRVGLVEGFFADIVHDEVAAAVLSAARTLENAGAAIETLESDGLEGARVAWMNVCTPEFASAHPLLEDPERRKLVAPSVREWLDRGGALTSREREDAQSHRRDVARWYRSRLEGLDALLIPTTPYPAPRADQEEVDLGSGRTLRVDQVGPGWITCSVNLAGLPALSLPAGRSSDGLPIGASLVGHDDGEERLLALAAEWEREAAYRPGGPAPA